MPPSASSLSSLSSAFEQDVKKSTVKPLLRLRSDLTLLPAEQSNKGLPSWTLYDPLRGKFYRIGWVEFELLKRWNSGVGDAIIQQVNRETTIRATASHVENLQTMLIENELVELESIGDITKLLQRKHARRVSLIRRLFTLALFYKKPLINPDKLLQKLDAVLRPAYRHKKLFCVLITALAIFVAFGFSAHAFELKDTFVQYMNPGGFLWFALILVFTNVIHEIGHGLVAKHYGCSVRQMGMALIFMLPVCYCDTTDAWRLKDSRRRLLINAGGMATEALLALLAGFLWLIFPEGIFKTFAFFVAITSLGTTLFINLNPFLKFDGYYLLADFLKIDNFQEKSFSTMRWQLRSWVLGYQSTMPHRVSRSQKRVMCVYAAATWLYRFFLYQIIALMVYQFWFKALGIVLMSGVVCTMLVQPVVKELVFYSRSIREHGVNVRTWCSGVLFIALMLIFLVPLPRMVSAPAVLSASQMIRFFAPVSSQVKSVHIRVGDEVRQGQLLVELYDPELVYRRDSLEQELELLTFKLSRQGSWDNAQDENRITENDRKAKLASLEDVQQAIADLKITATEAGQIVSMPNWLTAGVWIAHNDVLAELAQKRSPEVRAYVKSKHIERVQNDRVSFYSYPDNTEYPMSSVSISAQSINVLTDESLAVSYGGDIAVDQTDNGDLMPIQDWHQLKLRFEDIAAIDRERKGYVMFSAQPRSIAASALSQTYGVLIRESGF